MPPTHELTETVRKLRQGVPVPEGSLDALAEFLERYHEVTIGPAPEAGQWPKGWVAADQAQGQFVRSFNAGTDN